MDDLMQFLRARLDDDAAAAIAATGREWGAVDRMQPFVILDVQAHHGNRTLAAVGVVAAVEQAANRDHITRHDPARVLAEVDAKRRRLTRHTPERRRLALNDEGGTTSFAFLVCTSCTPNRTIEIGQAVVEWPCPDLLADASVYAEHPDYREEWTP